VSAKFMDRKEMLRMDTVYIPSNYTDAGKLLGAFALRQVAECAAICLPLAAMVFLLCPLGLTGKIIVCAVLVVPAGGFALLGVQDNSLLTFARLYSRWRKNRRILIYRGTQWIHANQKKNKKGSI
jgi:hypothetical protein